jgi:tRNA(Ile)-lysidine synthase
MQQVSEAKSVNNKSADNLKPAQAATDRFERAIKVLAGEDRTIGVAVSGGPDSLALLLLAAATRPGKIEAATVDHDLREGSRKEAEMVADLCKMLGVPHEILTVNWDKKPTSAIQERARLQRYKALGEWAKEKKIDVVVTAHHSDDQAETLLMRLVRGSGIRGLAGMRALRKFPGSNIAIARPLLRWTRGELGEICVAAGIEPAIDPSNSDPKFERVRVRETLAASEWLDPVGLAKSAAYLSQADEALRWATKQEWDKRVTEADSVITFDPAGLPNELRRRIVQTILGKLKTEGRGIDMRGRELDQLLAALSRGRQATLRGVLCGGGETWRFAKAPKRKKVAANS